MDVRIPPRAAATSADEEAPMFTKLAWFTVRRRRLVLALSALFVVAAAAIGAGAFGVLRAGGFEDPDAESSRATDALDEVFDTGDPNVVLLVRSPSGTVDDAVAADAGADLTERLAQVPDVDEVASYWTLGQPTELRSAAGDEGLLPGRVTTDDDEAKQTPAD